MALRPADMPAAAGRVFQLHEGSVSPTRVVERDEDGFAREETICALAKHELFVDKSGNVCTVPLQTGRVLSQDSDAERYEMIMRRDQILGGSLPLSECPYTAEYRKWTGTPTLVKVPKGEQDCGGRPEGCEHLHRIIESRREKSRKAFDAAQRVTYTQEQVDATLANFAKIFGVGSAGAVKGGRANLAAGRGEKDEDK
jgi:hypothetical protein